MKKLSNTRQAKETILKVAQSWGMQPMISVGQREVTGGIRESLYVDGDILSEYNGMGQTGWKFRNEVDEKLGQLYIEPYTSSIWDVEQDGQVK